MSYKRITKWHVCVKVPDEISTRYRETQEWGIKTCEATAGSIEAGSDWYSDHEEWADFWTEQEAQECDRKLIAMLDYYKAKLIEDKERERLEDEDV